MKMGKRKRGRYPFQKIVHFFYICSASRLLHGVCRYVKVCLPRRGGGGEGRERDRERERERERGREVIVRSFMFPPFLIFHSHARPGMFLISVVKDHEHLISFLISDLLASLEICFCETASRALPPWG